MIPTLNSITIRRSTIDTNPHIQYPHVRKPSNKNRNTKIHCSVCVRNGEEHILIRKIERVAKRADLPDQYLRVGPWYYKSDTGTVYVKGAKRRYTLRVGLYYPLDEFCVVVDLMRAAGNKLTRINKKSRFVVEI